MQDTLVPGAPEPQRYVFFFFDKRSVHQHIDCSQHPAGNLTMFSAAGRKQVFFQNISGIAPDIFLRECSFYPFQKRRQTPLVFFFKGFASQNRQPADIIWRQCRKDFGFCIRGEFPAVTKIPSLGIKTSFATVPATGHDYETEVVREPHCETEGERKFHCTKCEKEYYSDIPATGHNYELTGTEEVNGENIRTYVCTNCGAITTQNMGEQYEQVSSYIGYLFGQYQPYMWWTLLATAGVWSIVMGVFFAIAQKNEDKEKARKMIKNYVIGLVVIFAILVACPYLVKGIAALIAG